MNMRKEENERRGWDMQQGNQYIIELEEYNHEGQGTGKDSLQRSPSTRGERGNCNKTRQQGNQREATGHQRTTYGSPIGKHTM